MSGITTAMCTSFKVELLSALHNFLATGGNIFKMALIKHNPAGTYDAASTNYSNITGNSDEVSGTGYTAGGAALTNVDPTSGGTTGYTTFSTPVQWTGATINTDGCMIYNSTNSGRAVGVFDFGGQQVVTAGTFSVNMPTTAPSTALIRIA
jgi:hypothetical protein